MQFHTEKQQINFFEKCWIDERRTHHLEHLGCLCLKSFPSSLIKLLVLEHSSFFRSCSFSWLNSHKNLSHNSSLRIIQLQRRNSKVLFYLKNIFF